MKFESAIASVGLLIVGGLMFFIGMLYKTQRPQPTITVTHITRVDHVYSYNISDWMFILILLAVVILPCVYLYTHLRERSR